MYNIELYKRGVGVIQKFPELPTKHDCELFVENYCKENNLKIIAREWCDNATWCYLNNGSEIDYCLKEN